MSEHRNMFRPYKNISGTFIYKSFDKITYKKYNLLIKLKFHSFKETTI